MTQRKTFEEGRGYSQEDWDEVSDNPELTAEQLAEMRPMSEVLPELHASLMKVMAERDAEKGKTPISIRLDDDIAEKLRASGPGWQSRANDALRAFVDGKS